MMTLVFGSSFKRAFKNNIKRRPELKPKIEAKLRLLAADPLQSNFTYSQAEG